MSSPAFEVIVCGSLHLDIIVRAPELPRIDETAVGTSWEQVCGGKGGNQAMQAARAGAKTAMIGRVGSDDFGARLRGNLRSAGVDTSCVGEDADCGSGMSAAILKDNGDYGAVIVSGANLAIDAAEIQRDWDRLGGAKALILQNEVPHDVNVAAARAARGSGAAVIFNAAPARPSDRDLMACVDVLVVNRVEAELLFGRAVGSRDDTLAAFAAMPAAGFSVVVTLGGDGLVVVPKDEPPVAIEPIPVSVRSTHGAGDCFVGTLAARLARGDGLVAACRLANAAAAAFVSR